MHDKAKVLTGIGIFFVVVLFPVWFSIAGGGAGEMPDEAVKAAVEEAKKHVDACVEDAAYMRASHMDLLNRWRNEVVRDGEREYVAPSGGKHEKSLTRTCLGCHTSKVEFCDKCHDYVGVVPNCWECHNYPERPIGVEED